MWAEVVLEEGHSVEQGELEQLVISILEARSFGSVVAEADHLLMELEGMGAMLLAMLGIILVRRLMEQEVAVVLNQAVVLEVQVDQEPMVTYLFSG